MSRRGRLIAFAMLVPLAALAAWWFDTFERIEKDVAAPLHGEAHYNPLYALKATLQARGVTVESRANLNLQAMALGSDDTLVLAADVRTLSDDQVDELLDWVEDGGHLIFSLPQGKEGRGGKLLDALGLSVVSRSSCWHWPVDGDAEKASRCFGFAFKLNMDKVKGDQTKQFALLVGDAEKGYVLGRRTREDGTWFVASNLNFLYTGELNEPGNAELTWQVLGPLADKGKVHLVYAANVPPWYVLLIYRGWPALLPVLLALLAWLWTRSQRFGPLLPLAAAHRRALREHVQAAGEFTFRRGRGAALYAPMRRAFDEWLRRDDPALAALDGDALVTALAERSGKPPAVVRIALSPFNLAEPEQFYTTIKVLTELRTRP
jgi:hypothetical protein